MANINTHGLQIEGLTKPITPMRIWGSKLPDAEPEAIFYNLTTGKLATGKELEIKRIIVCNDPNWIIVKVLDRQTIHMQEMADAVYAAAQAHKGGQHNG